MHQALAPVAPAPPAPVALDARLAPPLIHGAAELAHHAYARPGLDALLARVARPAATAPERAALLLDRSFALALHFHAEAAAALQAEALAACRRYRVASPALSASPLRLLALLAPGTLMVNTPLDFITRHLDVRLDLLFVDPAAPLPALLPDHDVAFFAASECAPPVLRRLAPLFASWPRPALNDPAAMMHLSRDGLARAFARTLGLHTPPVLRATRDDIALGAALPMLARAPLLIRPVGSHAGTDLARIDAAGDLTAYLDRSEADTFFLTRFVDYRDADGMFRKRRVAFIDRVPFLCHQASSPHWMVHYLNAGMAEHAERRAEEARAMAGFERGFARRHAAAFATLCDWTGLDYFQIDCAEMPDGRLLLFEVAVAGIVHLLDPPDLFPYKPPQMRRIFEAFDAMLRRRVSRAGTQPAFAPPPDAPASSRDIPAAAR